LVENVLVHLCKVVAAQILSIELTNNSLVEGDRPVQLCCSVGGSSDQLDGDDLALQ